MALADIDSFKAVNDAHGHPGGDSLLIQVATDWPEVLRPDDVLARIGGDEFAVLVPACSTAEAADVVRRLHARMPEPYSCSIGLATWDGAEPADHLMARADQALYDAKRRGTRPRSGASLARAADGGYHQRLIQSAAASTRMTSPNRANHRTAGKRVAWTQVATIPDQEAPSPKPGGKRRKRSVRVAPTIERAEVSVHGHRVIFTIAGKGAPVVLIHGVAGRAAQWMQVIELLAQPHMVVAPDLLGHGESAKPRGDYSLGAHASGIRDLLVGLNIERASIVGHSLGGGIAMQFAYQFPERCERLVLVSSGGLGEDVHSLLRAATLPGSEFVLPVVAHPRVLALAAVLPRALGRLGLHTGPDLTEMARGYQSLYDRESRSAFIHTLRAVVDPTGQRVDASDRLYLASQMPSMIVWGAHDRIIPVKHGRSAHEGMPGSRLEIFERAGHFPQLEDPVRFARTLEDFLDRTEPARLDTAMMHKLVLDQDSGSAAVLKRLRREHPIT